MPVTRMFIAGGLPAGGESYGKCGRSLSPMTKYLEFPYFLAYRIFLRFPARGVARSLALRFDGRLLAVGLPAAGQGSRIEDQGGEGEKWRLGARQAKRAARTASFTRTCSVPCRRRDPVPPSARRTLRAFGPPARCASCFARSAGSRSPGRFPRPTSRSGFTPDQIRFGHVLAPDRRLHCHLPDHDSDRVDPGSGAPAGRRASAAGPLSAAAGSPLPPGGSASA